MCKDVLFSILAFRINFQNSRSLSMCMNAEPRQVASSYLTSHCCLSSDKMPSSITEIRLRKCIHNEIILRWFGLPKNYSISTGTYLGYLRMFCPHSLLLITIDLHGPVISKSMLIWLAVEKLCPQQGYILDIQSGWNRDLALQRIQDWRLFKRLKYFFSKRPPINEVLLTLRLKKLGPSLLLLSLHFVSTWNETMLTLVSSEHSTVVLRNLDFHLSCFCVISFWNKSQLFVFASPTRLMTLWREI